MEPPSVCVCRIPTNSRDITTTWNVFSGIHASSTPTIPICEKVLSLILSLARIRESVGTCAALRDNGVGYRILQHPSYMLCTDGRRLVRRTICIDCARIHHILRGQKRMPPGNLPINTKFNCCKM
jgi:hypothetical protein